MINIIIVDNHPIIRRGLKQILLGEPDMNVVGEAAGAQDAFTRIRATECDVVVLEIRDNGRGITEEEMLNPESLGLLGMKERVLAFGGDLSICGEPGGGTALILKIPQDKKTSPQA